MATELAYLTEERTGLAASDVLSRLKKLRQLCPESAEVQWALSDAYTTAKMSAEARQAGREAIRLAPGPDNVAQLVDTLTEEERTAEAKAVLAQGLKATPNDETLLATRAMNLATEGKTAEAIAAYQALLRIGTPWAHYRTRIADLYVSRKDLKHAAETFQSARLQRPQDASICEKSRRRVEGFRQKAGGRQPLP